MSTQRVLVALTIANAGMLIVSLSRPEAVGAQEIAPVLRGRAFEIVDDHGRVRAEIKVHPAQPTLKMPDGSTGYPETVLLRLFTSKGGPNVKIAATEDGSGVVLGGDPGVYTQMLTRGSTPFVKLVTKSGQHTIKP